MKKTFIKVILLATFVSILGPVVLSSGLVQAAAGDGYGGGKPGCDYEVSTCAGGSWKWYSTTSNSVTIANYGSVQGGTITGCAAAGGYWRFALEDSGGVQRGLWPSGHSRKTGYTGPSAPVAWIGPADGTPSPDGNNRGAWDQVQMFFDQAVALGQNDGRWWGYDSPLAWFCSAGSLGTPPPTHGNNSGSGTPTPASGAVIIESRNVASDSTASNQNWTTEGNSYQTATLTSGASGYGQESFWCSGTLMSNGSCAGTWISQWNNTITQANVAINTVSNWPYNYIWAKPRDSIEYRSVISKDWRNTYNSHGDQRASYGACSVSGAAGTISCTDDVVQKDQNSTVQNSQSGQTLKQSIATDRTYAYQSNFHCHLPASNGRCSGFDFNNVTAAGTGSSSTAIKVPYNYTTDPRVETPGSQGGAKIVYPGQDINVGSFININKKPNDPVSPSDYATRTKETIYEVVTFVAQPTSSKPGGYDSSSSVTGSTTYPGVPGTGTSCGFYTSGMTLRRSCSVVSRNTGRYNDSINPLNGSTNESLWGGSINIDDAPVGTKFCVAVSVWPATSHNSATASSTGVDGEPSMSESGAGSAWQHSAPLCFDIAKKPNLQVWGSSIFTNGSIISSQSNKKQGDGTYRLFGSWSEYAAISRNVIDSFGTGAAFGYELNNGGTFAKTGGLPNNGSTNSCIYSKATVTNSDCNSLGNAGISDSSVAVTTARLLARYASPTGKNPGGNTFSLSGLDGKYYVNGNVTINASNIPKGKTIVVYATGNITIAGNITYNNGPYTNITDLPQVILIGQNIYINESVTRVDAWLVAGRQGGTGIIDTCAGFNIGSLGANNCNQQLTINGPVFANKLVTKRTAGADAGEDSINPGEVFNLRPDAYLWAMAQAQNYRQAVVTNLKSLPPRY